MNEDLKIPDDLSDAYHASQSGADFLGSAFIQKLIKRIARLEVKQKGLEEKLADEQLAFEHANDVTGKYMGDLQALQ